MSLAISLIRAQISLKASPLDSPAHRQVKMSINMPIFASVISYQIRDPFVSNSENFDVGFARTTGLPGPSRYELTPDIHVSRQSSWDP